jgi:ribosome recycling factor
MPDSILTEATARMNKCIEALKVEFNKIRSGRAHPSALDTVRVLYYGNPVPISQVANVNVEDPRTLGIVPWEKTMIPAIEKAIIAADLGLNPSTSGGTIRISMPSPNEARRKEMVKAVSHEAEQAKVAVRNVRREANTQVKDLLKAKKITEDDVKRSEDRIQKLTDQKVEEIDLLFKKKEQDLMEV